MNRKNNYKKEKENSTTTNLELKKNQMLTTCE